MRCKWELSPIKVVKWNNEPFNLIMIRLEQVFHVEHSYGADLPKEEAARPEWFEEDRRPECAMFHVEHFHSTMHQTRALLSQERTNYSSQPAPPSTKLWDVSSQSPTRRAASVRLRPLSTLPLHLPQPRSIRCWSTATRSRIPPAAWGWLKTRSPSTFTMSVT